MSNQKIMRIAWPAFLAACVLELLVFALVDPHDLRWSGQSLGLSRQGVYSAAFFLFWAISMTSSALSAMLGLPPAQGNQGSLAPGERADRGPRE